MMRKRSRYEQVREEICNILEGEKEQEVAKIGFVSWFF